MLALFVCSSCLELTGQRITIRYDRPADRLLVLLEYDGISNDDEEEQEDAERKLRDFVANGDVMLFDWFGHFRLGELTRARADAPPAERALLEYVRTSVDVVLLGHYRDVDGRIGAAQLVVLREASRGIALANAAIDEAFRGETREELWARAHWGRTFAKWKLLAAAGAPRWLALEGDALLYRFPVDAREWHRAKLAFFADLAKERPEGDAASVEQRILAAAPLSLLQTEQEVVVRFGDSAQPSTMRCELRDTYAPNLERAVAAAVPEDLDAQIAAAVLDSGAAAGPLGELLAWGPAEDRVRAVLAVARRAEDARSARAARWLADFAARWNAAGRAPEAPAGEALDAAAWEQWYRDVVGAPEL
jgi:hypothetical protein